ncbi:hypothetical protein DRO49_06160, partial [Candidatus Bathyarchaeota archaeon]
MSGGNTDGTDAGWATATREFDYNGGSIHLTINYRVAVQTDNNDDGWGGAASTTDVIFHFYDSSGSELASQTYRLSSTRCAFSDPNNDPDVIYVIPPGVSRDSDGDIHLDPDTWYTLDITPSSDVNVSWSDVAKVEVELKAGGAWMHADTIEVYFDDMDLTIGNDEYEDHMNHPEWTFGFTHPNTSSQWSADYYPPLCESVGPYTIENLDPDPNPQTSEVMMGGKVCRYYKVTGGGGDPADGASVKVKCNGKEMYFATDDEGLLKIELESKDLGNPNETIDCEINAVCGEPYDPPITFSINILPRESTLYLKFGSGANVGAAIGVGGKLGEKKGMVYKIKNTDINSSSDDEIGFDKLRELEVGVYAEASIGGGVKEVCYAQAGAEAGISGIVSGGVEYLFQNPYYDQESILRAGLIISTLFEDISSPPFVNSIMDFILNQYNPIYGNYVEAELFSAGMKVYGGASAGAGLGIGDSENVLLGAGVGAGISGEAQIMVNLINGNSENGAGVSF